MSSTNEFELQKVSEAETEQELTFTEDPMYLSDYIRVENHIEEVAFKIADYLASESRRDLFTKLTMGDIALFLYKPSYIQFLKEKVPNTIL